MRTESGTSAARLWLLRLFVLILVVGTNEGLARIYRHFVPSPGVGLGYPAGLYIWDPLCDYRCTPGFRGAFRDRFSDIPIRINSAGYRDDDFAVARTPGVRRVAFLGDSVTFGPGVRAEERFSDLLRRAAAARGAPIETQNFAINAYSAFHYEQQARRVLPLYEPDAVVVGLCLNDVEPRELSWPRNFVAPPGRPDAAHVEEQNPRVRLRDRSALLSVLFELPLRIRNREPWLLHMRRTVSEWEDRALRDALRGHLASLKAALAPRPIVVLVLPEAHDVKDPDHFGAPRLAAISLVHDVGLAEIDVFEDFRRTPDPDELFLAGDALHLSARGHARVAALLESWLASVPAPALGAARPLDASPHA